MHSTRTRHALDLYPTRTRIVLDSHSKMLSKCDVTLELYRIYIYIYIYTYMYTIAGLALPARGFLGCSVHFVFPVQVSSMTFKCLHTQLTTATTLSHGQSGLNTAERMIPFHWCLGLWLGSRYNIAIITTDSCVVTGGYGVVRGSGRGW